jgi:cutinase
MKFAAVVALLAAAAAAVPTGLERRQFGGMTENELKSGSCKKITLVYARGSTEMGTWYAFLYHQHVKYAILPRADTHQGSSLGPPTCSGLKRKFPGQVACQGVGGAYNAGLGTNALSGDGTSAAAYGEAEKMFNLAASKCPDTIIVGGGYSQGAAVMVASVRRLPEATKAKMAGVVLYGNTRNRQEHGKIPNFPEDKALTICNASDGVCGGALLVTPGHLTYQTKVPKAVSWLAERIQAQESSGGGSSSSSAASSTDSSASDDSSSSGSSGGSGLFGGLRRLRGGSAASANTSADTFASADTSTSTAADSSADAGGDTGASSGGGSRFSSFLSKMRGMRGGK